MKEDVKDYLGIRIEGSLGGIVHSPAGTRLELTKLRVYSNAEQKKMPLPLTHSWLPTGEIYVSKGLLDSFGLCIATSVRIANPREPNEDMHFILNFSDIIEGIAHFEGHAWQHDTYRVTFIPEQQPYLNDHEETAKRWIASSPIILGKWESTHGATM